MAKIVNKAVVLLDDFQKTGSNGGVVIDVFKWDLEKNVRPDKLGQMPPMPYSDVDPKKYIVLNCRENCKIGWIYTSKTNILVDSNEPPK
jgi:hypothetical protein